MFNRKKAQTDCVIVIVIVIECACSSTVIPFKWARSYPSVSKQNRSFHGVAASLLFSNRFVHINYIGVANAIKYTRAIDREAATTPIAFQHHLFIWFFMIRLCFNFSSETIITMRKCVLCNVVFIHTAAPHIVLIARQHSSMNESLHTIGVSCATEWVSDFRLCYRFPLMDVCAESESLYAMHSLRIDQQFYYFVPLILLLLFHIFLCVISTNAAQR